MHDNIKKYFGKEWLNKQRREAATEILSKGTVDSNVAFSVGDKALEKIDKIIGKIENVKGFLRWVKEASSADQKGFADIAFELFCFENLKFDSNSVLKPINSKGCGVEASMKTSSKELYIEMLNMTEISTTPKNKVHAFFKKAKRKFTDKNGILFIDISKFNNIPDPSSDVLTLSPTILKIQEEIMKKFNHGLNEKTDAIVLVNLVWVTNSTGRRKVDFDKRFILIPKPEHNGGMPKEFWGGILKVDKFFVEMPTVNNP